ncbi:uncharacterized protein LOC136065225 [Quercus suber]|uniref:uncharacterized protein LOC136065225 n=1 Tax=Quercus suber TaxID=58331 RepID=UPI0032DF02EE
MGLKRQPQTNLLDLLEGGSKNDVPGESQPQPPAPQPQILTMQTRSSSVPTVTAPPTESPDPKRKRLSKGKEPIDGSKSHSSPEEGRTRRPPKQLRLGDQRKSKKATQQPEAQAWLPAAMLHDQPLMDNASMRESQGDEGALVAEALEKSLLLPIDMAELEKMSGVEVVLDLKKYLGMALFRLGEEVDDHSNALAQERDKFLEAANTLKRSEADLKKATEDLAKMAKARDTAVSDLAVAIHEKGVAEYARDEAVRAKDEAVFAKTDAERSMEKAEEDAFAEGVAKTEAILRAQEALNQAGVDASSDLRREDRVYYPIAIREVAPAAPEEGSSLPSVESQDRTAEDVPLTDQPSEEVEPQRVLGKVVTEGEGIPQDMASPPADLLKSSP